MSHQTYLTTAGIGKLKTELEDLKSTKRPAIVERLRAALEMGDLSENSEYDDAKNEQAFVEGRITEIEQMLSNAEVVKKSGNGAVSLGATVTVKHDGKTSTFTIVGAAEADPTAGMISNESPLGQALLTKAVGETAVATTPRGDISYQITAIK